MKVHLAGLHPVKTEKKRNGRKGSIIAVRLQLGIELMITILSLKPESWKDERDFIRDRVPVLLSSQVE